FAMPRTECLTAAELAAFHLGDLPEADLLELAGHLERCPRCDQEAQALDGLSDATLAAYRQSALAGPLPAGDELPQRGGDHETLEKVGRPGLRGQEARPGDAPGGDREPGPGSGKARPPRWAARAERGPRMTRCPPTEQLERWLRCPQDDPEAGALTAHVDD